MAVLDMTQGDLAVRLEVSRQAVHGLLSRDALQFETLQRLEVALEVEPGWLARRMTVRQCALSAIDEKR
jgi:DNA-binding Xre family transcriptional regulator